MSKLQNPEKPGKLISWTPSFAWLAAGSSTLAGNITSQAGQNIRLSSALKNLKSYKFEINSWIHSRNLRWRPLNVSILWHLLQIIWKKWSLKGNPVKSEFEKLLTSLREVAVVGSWETVRAIRLSGAASWSRVAGSVASSSRRNWALWPAAKASATICWGVFSCGGSILGRGRGKTRTVLHKSPHENSLRTNSLQRKKLKVQVQKSGFAH